MAGFIQPQDNRSTLIQTFRLTASGLQAAKTQLAYKSGPLVYSFSLSGLVSSGANTNEYTKSYVLVGTLPTTATIPQFNEPVYAGHTKTLVKASYIIQSGTSCTFTAYHNGVAISALTGLSATGTIGSTTCSVSVSDGDSFYIAITAVSGAPVGMTVNFYFTEVF